ncbi:MAG TPA: carboxypeptidase-like regulatory domain-containing protein [Chitinophagaceae bacterium]|nr:carboxypeptidase-like regulatory domain-containing protein [Chitinophagaceae bacterium]
MFRVLLLGSILISLTSNAQVKISGKVTDNHNKPLRGISISIKDSYDGATSDSTGGYSFVTTEKGAHILQATATGYKSFQENININQAALKINITLREEITELKAVVISAGTFEASDQKRASALTPLDIVTTASANADITSALKTLPGTQQVGESEGLFVRGGTAEESKIFIDGTLINKFFYSSEPELATRGRFNPFLFKGTIFSSGGYSALYGQALSSVLLLESIDLPERTSADFGISYLGVNGGLQKLSKNKKSSWGFTYSYTNLAVAFGIIKQKQGYFKVPVLNEGDANFRIKTSPTGILKYFGSFSTSNVGLRNQDVDSLTMKDAFGLKNLYMYHNLSWRESVGKGWKLNTGISYSNNRDDINNELQNADNEKQILNDSLYAYKNFRLANRDNYFNGKIVFEKKLLNLNAIRFGSEYNYSNEKTTYTQYNGIEYPQTVKENLWAVFAETDVYLTNDIAAKIGARAEHSQLLNKWNLAPRISLAYKFQDNSQLSLAYGIFYENPDRKYLPTINKLDFSQATHYILQYQKISNQRTFRAEAFYKKYKDLYKTSLTGYGELMAVNNNGFGDAKGIEFFWRDKKTIKNVDYWVSYSYLDTKRDFLNYPFEIVPPFATKHTASLVMKKFATKLKTQFNASYTFATGRPYYNINYDYTSNSYKIFDQGHTKDYNDLSLSVNYLPDIGKTNAKKFTVFVLSVSNVLGFNNVYTYNYSFNNQHKLAVTPPSKRFIYLGCFISFGIDRSQDEINNHL